MMHVFYWWIQGADLRGLRWNRITWWLAQWEESQRTSYKNVVIYSQCRYDFRFHWSTSGPNYHLNMYISTTGYQLYMVDINTTQYCTVTVVFHLTRVPIQWGQGFHNNAIWNSWQCWRATQIKVEEKEIPLRNVWFGPFQNVYRKFSKLFISSAIKSTRLCT